MHERVSGRGRWLGETRVCGLPIAPGDSSAVRDLNGLDERVAEIDENLGRQQLRKLFGIRTACGAKADLRGELSRDTAGTRVGSETGAPVSISSLKIIKDELL